MINEGKIGSYFLLKAANHKNGCAKGKNQHL
jgi:hypothetical protein